MKSVGLKPEKHIIVCVNQRNNESCCKNVGGEEVYLKLKQFINSNGLTEKIWITKTGCLGFCSPFGTTIVMYPEGIWLKEVLEGDIIELIGIIKNN